MKDETHKSSDNDSPAESVFSINIDKGNNLVTRTEPINASTLAGEETIDWDDLEKQVRAGLYKDLPKCQKIDRIAIKIFSTANWVFFRNAEKSNKEDEVKDYYNAENELTKNADTLTLKELLSNLTDVQRRILNFFNPDKKADNHYNAKRYIGFLLADQLLANCQCQEHHCPDQSLKEEYVEYLQGLTIEEFVRYKAYLRWYERTKDSCEKIDNKKLEDYLVSMKFLDGSMNNCKKRKCEDVAVFWQKVVERKFQSQKDVVDLIKQAKMNSLRRLLPDMCESNKTYVEDFVSGFYKHVLELSSENLPSPEIAIKIVNSIYEKPQVINMFEFLLKCLLLTRLTQEKHESLLEKNSKPVIKSETVLQPLTV